tara:strand:- start:21401 stop:21676 length:276 start_codon:yes stop_codon:yes gene_type:complete
MGYVGFGPGIDDPSYLPVLKRLAEANLPIFFLPNYGLPGDVFGPCYEHLRRNGKCDAMVKKDAADECCGKGSKEYRSAMGVNAMQFLTLSQ